MGSVRPAVDELQRDLEVELVDFLRQQNAQLMMQVSDLKTALEARGDQASAGSSPWSTVVEGESLGKRSAMGAGQVDPQDQLESRVMEVLSS